MDQLGKILRRDLTQGVMSRMLMADVKESEATPLTLAQAKANGTYVRMLDANGNTVRVARDTFIQAIRDLLPSVLADQDTNGKNFLTLLTDGTLGKTTLANAASVLGVKETVSLSSGTNLNNIKDTTKIYTCSSATTASSLVNCPVSVGFKMYVISVNTVDTPTAPRVAQVIIANHENGNVYIRKILGSSVSNWYLHSGTVV